MKLSKLIMRLQELHEKYGDIEGDVLVEDLSEKGFGQIEQEFGEVCTDGRDPPRFKLLPKDFT